MTVFLRNFNGISSRYGPQLAESVVLLAGFVASEAMVFDRLCLFEAAKYCKRVQCATLYVGHALGRDSFVGGFGRWDGRIRRELLVEVMIRHKPPNEELSPAGDI